MKSFGLLQLSTSIYKQETYWGAGLTGSKILLLQLVSRICLFKIQLLRRAVVNICIANIKDDIYADVQDTSSGRKRWRELLKLIYNEPSIFLTRLLGMSSMNNIYEGSPNRDQTKLSGFFAHQ